MTAWDECLLKLRLAVVACQNAEDAAEESLRQCHECVMALDAVEKNRREWAAVISRN